MLTVEDIMSREPYTLGPDNTLADARQMMTEHHIRHVPVVSGDATLVGVVSQRDVLAAENSTVLNAAGEHSTDKYVAVSTIMTTPVKTVDEHASLRASAMHLQKNKLGCLPVLAGGKLVGIITDSDFVAIAINLMEQLEIAEPLEPDFDDME